jgi:hypothetical protein
LAATPSWEQNPDSSAPTSSTEKIGYFAVVPANNTQPFVQPTTPASITERNLDGSTTLDYSFTRLAIGNGTATTERGADGLPTVGYAAAIGESSTGFLTALNTGSTQGPRT